MTTKIVKKKLLELYSFSFSAMVYTFLKSFILPFEEFSEYLPKKGLFIDFGTGLGYMANFISLGSQDRNVIGIDIDHKRISIAQKTITGRKNINFICGDIKKCNLVDTADVVTMADVLHHIPPDQHKLYIQCIYEKLKPGGRFILRETNKKNSIKYYLMNYFSEVLLYPFASKCYFYTAGQLKKLLEESGFKIISHKKNNPWFIYETIVYVCSK